MAEWEGLGIRLFGRVGFEPIDVAGDFESDSAIDVWNKPDFIRDPGIFHVVAANRRDRIADRFVDLRLTRREHNDDALDVVPLDVCFHQDLLFLRKLDILGRGNRQVANLHRTTGRHNGDQAERKERFSHFRFRLGYLSGGLWKGSRDRTRI